MSIEETQGTWTSKRLEAKPMLKGKKPEQASPDDLKVVRIVDAGAVNNSDNLDLTPIN